MGMTRRAGRRYLTLLFNRNFRRPVSGHDFSRAERTEKTLGFSPCGLNRVDAKPRPEPPNHGRLCRMEEVYAPGPGGIAASVSLG